MKVDKIKSFVGQNKDLLFKIHKELCLIPAPSGEERARAEYCLAKLRELGFCGSYIDGAENVICPIGAGSDSLTVICAHTDTVFPDKEPMPYREEEGKIFSPGVGDDTASVAILLLAAKYFAEQGFKPEHGLLLVFNSCEEGLGNLKGTRALMQEYKGRVASFVSFDGWRLNELSNRCVGSCRYKVTVSTEGGHSWDSFGNTSAIAEAAKIINKIYELAPKDEEGSKTTYNVGIINGGTSVNTIAEYCELLCEYRSESAVSMERMRTEFEKIFDSANTDAVRINTEIIGERPCMLASVKGETDKLANCCSSVASELLGEKIKYTSASTDCNIPLSLGVPAVCMSVFRGAGAHTREEWVEKDSMILGTELAIKVIEKLCK